MDKNETTQSRTLEDMDMPCPSDICDGSGFIDDDSDRVRRCPCNVEDMYDPDLDI